MCTAHPPGECPRGVSEGVVGSRGCGGIQGLWCPGGGGVQGVVFRGRVGVRGRGCPIPPGPDHLPCDHVTFPMLHLVSPPPWIGQTDACENITFTRFATRAVIKHSSWKPTLANHTTSVTTTRCCWGGGGFLKWAGSLAIVSQQMSLPEESSKVLATRYQ